MKRCHATPIHARRFGIFARGSLSDRIGGQFTRAATMGIPRHGHTPNGIPSPTYRSWMAMKCRCLRPGHPAYDKYGGRGISICERWMRFEWFLEDMGERPSSRHSIDRIDSGGHYTPENCRWSTPKQQSRNRRNIRFLTCNGETLCLAEWAERTGIRLNSIIRRLNRGCTAEEALARGVKNV